ncbi:MAG: hypothetical protein R8N24_02465 [Alphaproteobacteria bacterium]|nr:hypothetical protein [Alphaproteobacteria bacterium]
MKHLYKGLVLGAILTPSVAFSDSSELTQALQSVRQNCGGISELMSDLKTKAGINTAITGAGTVAGGVALGTGIAKAGVDSDIAALEKQLMEILKEKSQSSAISVMEKITYTKQDIQNLLSAITDTSIKTAQENTIKKLEELTTQSKTLGNVRTGTMAAATVTNIAGAAIAGTNKVDEDLSARIGACVSSVKRLADVKMQAHIEGSATSAEIAQADKIISACDKWSTVDLSPINKRATGAAVSSGIGAGFGLIGTITSASANSDKVRSGDAKQEKNLNTVSNVMAGTTAAASLTSTIFNATQISAIKHAATVADECQGAL